MEHKGTQVLETDRLILRQFTLDDADAMFTNWAGNPLVTKYLMWPTHDSVEVSRTVLADWITHYKEKNFYLWAIELKEIGEPIGSISCVEQDERTNMVHIGYCIGDNWWNKGITSEALTQLLDFFFNQVGVNRVESRHDPNNPHSGNVMKKCNMKYEGTKREADWNNQGICDAALYAILRKEYEESPINN